MAFRGTSQSTQLCPPEITACGLNNCKVLNWHNTLGITENEKDKASQCCLIDPNHEEYRSDLCQKVRETVVNIANASQQNLELEANKRNLQIASILESGDVETKRDNFLRYDPNAPLPPHCYAPLKTSSIPIKDLKDAMAACDTDIIGMSPWDF